MVQFEPGVAPVAGWIVLVVAGLVIGITKTGIPGIGILAVVSVASVMDAKASVGFVLPMLITGDIFAVIYYRRHAVWRHLLRLMPPALVGIGVGYWLLGRVEGDELGPIIGGIVIALLTLDAWRNRKPGELPVPTHPAFGITIGAVAGVTTMLSNAAGPLIVFYFLAMRFEKEKFIGTAAWYFLVLNCVKAPLFWDRGMIALASVRADACLAPAVLTGAVAGVFVLKRIPQKWFRVVVRLLALAGAIKLIVS
ncbi:MAG: sulfite exporter TauE/SafE family protein [Planctomycetota bacterium]